MADKYSNYAELAAAEEEGIDFEVVVVKREPPPCGSNCSPRRRD